MTTPPPFHAPGYARLEEEARAFDAKAARKAHRYGCAQCQNLDEEPCDEGETLLWRAYASTTEMINTATFAKHSATQAYAAFVAADEAWQAELERVHGAAAGDIRYTPAGRTGTLAPFYAEFRRTNDVWRAAQSCPFCFSPAHAPLCAELRAAMGDGEIDVEALIDSRDALLDRLAELEAVL